MRVTDCNALNNFSPICEVELLKIITSMSTKHCDLDPMPTWLSKQCHEIVVQIFTRIVNVSLTSGIFPTTLKHAIVKAILKKMNMECNELINYRPVSNLSFLSKVIEKCVSLQLTNHLRENGLQELYQSAYRSAHSVETALLCVTNDILTALDRKQSVVLLLLDLSAAFDTLDHNIMLRILENRLGITGVALKWLKSYLTDRTQHVSLNGHNSAPARLICGVPQGSVLGPLLFTAYMIPLGDIIRRYNIQHHFYADDTQLYFSLNNPDPIQSVTSLDECVCSVKNG